MWLKGFTSGPDHWWISISWLGAASLINGGCSLKTEVLSIQFQAAHRLKNDEAGALLIYFSSRHPRHPTIQAKLLSANDGKPITSFLRHRLDDTTHLCDTIGVSDPNNVA